MLIFGHKLLQNTHFHFVENITELQNDSISCIFYDENLISSLKAQNLAFAVLIKNKDEIFLASALGAKFLIFQDENLAKYASEVAEFYLFDTKLLFLVKELKNLDYFYALKVDGVLLKSAIDNNQKLIFL
ncbi:hypothetical protein [Campylobacter sp. VTCC 70190]|uniref:hypothetical protein n=1 Tax=Campylobacter sp. VTCC 70190 TaxID=3392118 RepID=UPI00398EE967